MTSAYTLGRCANCDTLRPIDIKDYMTATHWRCHNCHHILTFESITIPLENVDLDADAIVIFLTETIDRQHQLIEQLIGASRTTSTPADTPTSPATTDFQRQHSAEYQRLCQNFVQARARARSVTSGKLTGHNVGEIIDIDTKHRLAMQRLADFVVGEDKAE